MLFRRVLYLEGNKTMVKEISCIHAGFEDCEFLIRSENERELVKFVQKHAEQTHGVSVSRDHVEKIMREV